MADEKRTVELSDFEHRLLVGVLADYRNILIRDNKSTADVNDIKSRIGQILRRKVVENGYVLRLKAKLRKPSVVFSA